MRPAGPRAALYPAEFFELGAGEVVAYVPVATPVPAAGRVSMLQIPAAELAVAVHTGTLADVDQTYGALGIYWPSAKSASAGRSVSSTWSPRSTPRTSRTW